MKPVKVNLILFIYGPLIFLFIGIFIAHEPKHSFYDGEGNEIPYHAVNTLVQSQFVHVSKAEQDTINKYFKP